MPTIDSFLEHWESLIRQTACADGTVDWDLTNENREIQQISFLLATHKLPSPPHRPATG
jgi:hypothetical protein